MANLHTNEVQSGTKLSETQERNSQLEKLGEKLGQWKLYDSQLTLAEVTGTRIVKALYQVNKKTGKKLQENSYCRIPTKHLTEEIIVDRVTELSPFILEWLQEVESLMIREEHSKGSLQVFTEYLSLDKLISHLEEKQLSGRLNKDKISAWFTDYLLDELALKFAARLQITGESSELELAKLDAVLAAYKAKFELLASPKVFLKEEDCLAMITVIQSCEKAAGSLLGKQFITKLQGMNKKQDDLLMTL